MVGIPDIVCGFCTASALRTVAVPASRQACSRLDGIEPLRLGSFAYAWDASGILAHIAGSRHCHSRQPSSFRHRSAPEAPFLDRHYPASSVLRASPPPCRPGRPLAGFRLVRAHHRQGFPCCIHPPPTCVPPPIPRRNRLVRPSLASPADGSLPRITAGSASALPFSRPARRSLALRPACSLNRPWRPFSSECSRRCRYLLRPLRLLPAGATVAGRDSHPLRNDAFARRTVNSG